MKYNKLFLKLLTYDKNILNSRTHMTLYWQIFNLIQNSFNKH